MAKEEGRKARATQAKENSAKWHGRASRTVASGYFQFFKQHYKHRQKLMQSGAIEVRKWNLNLVYLFFRKQYFYRNESAGISITRNSAQYTTPTVFGKNL